MKTNTPRLPWPNSLYEFYNPWSGFNPCTLAEGWKWMLGVLRTRFSRPSPCSLAIYNRATNKTVAYWDGCFLRYGDSHAVMARSKQLSAKWNAL